MLRSALPVTVLAATLALASGCVSKKDFVAKSQQADRLAGDLTKERQRNAELSLRAATLEGQLGELARQLAATAEERDRLRGELNAARVEGARLAGQLAEASDQRDTLSRQLEIVQRATSEKDVNLQKLTYQYDDLVKNLEAQKGQLSRRVADLESRLKESEGRVQALVTERDALQAERLKLDLRGRELATELASTRRALGESRQALTATEQELAGSRDELAATRAALDVTGKELGTAREKLAATGRELAAAREQLAAARDEYASTAAALEAARAELGETQAQLAERERLLRETTATYDQLVADLKGEISEGQVKITRLRDRLTVNLVDRILFDSGSTAIKPGGQAVLRKVAEVLKGVTDKRVQIEGHTDNVPIAPSLQSRFPTNWELSVARATVVARFLQDQAGLDPRRLVATGYGEHHPVAPNDTPEGRAQNRRIEIVLVPAVEETALR